MKIVITGATSGIGKQLALDYHEDGHEVWAIGRNESVLKDLKNRGLCTKKLDLQQRDETIGWFSTLDTIDLAILNAGTCKYMDMPNFDSLLFSDVIRANVESMANCIEGILPLLKQSSNPHLVGVGSSASFVPFPRAEAYGSSKAAIDYLIRTLRITLAPENIAVSLVSPGFVKTPLTDKNDFPMPFLLTVEKASEYIRKGIIKKREEIHFPRYFTFWLKLFGLLPSLFWNSIAKRMVRK